MDEMKYSDVVFEGGAEARVFMLDLRQPLLLGGDVEDPRMALVRKIRNSIVDTKDSITVYCVCTQPPEPREGDADAGGCAGGPVVPRNPEMQERKLFSIAARGGTKGGVAVDAGVVAGAGIFLGGVLIPLFCRLATKRPDDSSPRRW
jgi:hypothetical protein